MSIRVLQSSWWGRELVALLNLSSWCLVMVERLFLAVPRGCLRFVIVVFPDHTHWLFLGVGAPACATVLHYGSDERKSNFPRGGGGGSGPPAPPLWIRTWIHCRPSSFISVILSYCFPSLRSGLYAYSKPCLFALWVFTKCRLLIFSKLTFSKKKSGIPLGCQTVWIQIRSDVLSGLIWVRTVSKLTSRLRMLKSLCPRFPFWEKREMIIRRGMIKTTTIPTWYKKKCLSNATWYRDGQGWRQLFNHRNDWVFVFYDLDKRKKLTYRVKSGIFGQTA